MTDYTVLTLTVWCEYCYQYKLMWILRQLTRGHWLQPDIYDYDKIRGITWIIIGDRLQYFRQSLMPSAFTENIIEIQITLPTSTLVLLVNQLSMDIPIRVSGIPEKWRDWYTRNRLTDNKQGSYKGNEEGGLERGTGQKYSKIVKYGTKKRAEIDPKLYTGELFLETPPKIKA